MFGITLGLPCHIILWGINFLAEVEELSPHYYGRLTYIQFRCGENSPFIPKQEVKRVP